MMMASTSTQYWKSLNTLSLFSDRLDRLMDDVKHQYDTLRAVQHRTRVFDRPIVSRILEVYDHHHHILSTYREYAFHWKREAFTLDQHAAIEYVYSQINRVQGVLNQIMHLLQSLAHPIVDKIRVAQHTSHLQTRPSKKRMVTNYLKETRFFYFQRTWMTTLFQSSM
jgi:hypothetical protein